MHIVKYRRLYYAIALSPRLTFWLNVLPETAFGREFKKKRSATLLEAGRGLVASRTNLYWSFISRYQTMIKLRNLHSWPRSIVPPPRTRTAKPAFPW